MPKPEPEFAFQHPAAEEANRIHNTLPVDSEEAYRRMPRRDRYLFDVGWFETEVTNGGLDQYLSNSIGGHALECLEALKAIGAKESYALLKQACDLFPEGRPSPDRETRQRQMRALGEAYYIDDVTSGFIEVELYQLLLDYYRKADPKEM